jgi:hypothetical protein
MRYMATGILLLFVTGAKAQIPPPSIPPVVPHPNPSSSLVLPQGPPIAPTFTQDRTSRAPIKWSIRHRVCSCPHKRRHHYARKTEVLLDIAG